MDDFKAYPKIEQIGKLYMSITQKIHGSNAQIYIRPGASIGLWDMSAGSRNRWLTPEDDNYGFCKWAYENKDALIQTLGEGRHYGEWCGKGINTGEGLDEKVFVLFDWWHYQDKNKVLPNGVRTVPVLYTGAFSYTQIDQAMSDLKENGSRLVSGYMKPEGIVIDINGNKYKKVFDPEETKWHKSDAPKIQHTNVDVSHLLQPLRLEKLLSRDERYRREYPESMNQLFKDYFADLVAEGQLNPEDTAIKKSLGKELYRFIRHHVENINELSI